MGDVKNLVNRSQSSDCQKQETNEGKGTNRSAFSIPLTNQRQLPYAFVSLTVYGSRRWIVYSGASYGDNILIHDKVKYSDRPNQLRIEARAANPQIHQLSISLSISLSIMIHQLMHLAPNWSLDADDEQERDPALVRRRRQEFLVHSMQASGISCAEHLQQLSLEQLEEIYKMSGSYDEQHYHTRSSTGDSSSYYNKSQGGSTLDQFWKFVVSENDWWSAGQCFSLYPTTMSSATSS